MKKAKSQESQAKSQEVQQSKKQSSDIGYKKYGWKNVAIKVKENDLIALNRQLDRLGYGIARRPC